MNINDIIKSHFGVDKDYTYLIDIIKDKYKTFKINEDNLKNLIIEAMSKEEFFRTGFVGIYQIEKNRIGIFTNKDQNGNKIVDANISNEELLDTFLHELIHALTSKIDENGNILEGINIRQNGSNSILLALNEGITQMISDDILGSFSDAYPFLKTFASQLSILIGKDNLIKYYSNNDIEGLVSTIDQIAGKGFTFNLINKINAFNLVTQNILEDGGAFIGDSIQNDLLMLRDKLNMKQNEEFNNLIIDSKKAKELSSMLPINMSIEKLGFRNNERNI